MEITANQLSAQMNVDYPTAANLLKLLVAQGQATEAGKVKTASGKGKPSILYSVPNAVVTINLKPVVVEEVPQPDPLIESLEQIVKSLVEIQQENQEVLGVAA